MRTGHPQQLAPDDSWMVNYGEAPRGLCSTLLMGSAGQTLTDIHCGVRWLSLSSSHIRKVAPWPGLSGSYFSSGQNPYRSLISGSFGLPSILDVTGNEISVFMLVAPDAHANNRGVIGHFSGGAKYVLWTGGGVNTFQFRIRISASNKNATTVADPELYDGRVVGLLGVYDGANVLIYTKKYSGDQQIKRVVGDAATGNLDPDTDTVNIGSYTTSSANNLPGIYFFSWISNRAVSQNEAKKFLDDPYHWLLPPWRRAAINANVPAAVATRNYYSGGSIAAQRLNRGIGWVQ